MSKSAISIEGFVANELGLREAGGKNVLDVSIPVTPQRLVDGKWEDVGETVWWRASFWEDHAGAVLMGVEKGSLVTVTGTGVRVDTYTKNDGTTGVNLSVINPTIAAVIRRPPKGQNRPANAPVADSWATSTPATETASWGADTETPF